MSSPLISVDWATNTGGVSLPANNTEGVILSSPTVLVPPTAHVVIIEGTYDAAPLPTGTVQMVIRCRRGTGITGVALQPDFYFSACTGQNVATQHERVSGIWIDQLPSLGLNQWTITGFCNTSGSTCPVEGATLLVWVA